jgi:hypothetical protein
MANSFHLLLSSLMLCFLLLGVVGATDASYGRMNAHTGTSKPDISKKRDFFGLLKARDCLCIFSLLHTNATLLTNKSDTCPTGDCADSADDKCCTNGGFCYSSEACCGTGCILASSECCSGKLSLFTLAVYSHLVKR